MSTGDLVIFESYLLRNGNGQTYQTQDVNYQSYALRNLLIEDLGVSSIDSLVYYWKTYGFGTYGFPFNPR